MNDQPHRHDPGCYLIAALDVTLILVLIVTIVIVAGRWITT